ncbi:hypothetical protein [Lysobacter sp. HA35]
MKRLWLGLVLFAALPASAAWLKMDRSEGGFLFRGAEEGEPFSFNVPGTSVRTAKDGDRAFAEIDGALMQIMLLPIPSGAGVDPVQSFKASEQLYLERAGAVVVASEVCRASAVPHSEWGSKLDGHVTYYLVTKAGERLLVITIVAADPKVPESAAPGVLAGVCSSLKVA